MLLDSVRAFKQRMKFGQYTETSEEEKVRKLDDTKKAEQLEREKAESIPLNGRLDKDLKNS